MKPHEESRRYPRLSTGPEYRALFLRSGPREIRALVQNLSACGCGLQVEMSDMGDLETGALIRSLFLDHPDLPYVPLEARVVRILGKIPEKKEGYALVGLDFHTITPFMRNMINNHILHRLR